MTARPPAKKAGIPIETRLRRQSYGWRTIAAATSSVTGIRTFTYPPGLSGCAQASHPALYGPAMFPAALTRPIFLGLSGLSQIQIGK
jgi:hypothetical protein